MTEPRPFRLIDVAFLLVVLALAAGARGWYLTDCAKAGTSSGPIITGQASPGGVAPNATDLYWATAGDGTIWESNLDGTSALAIVTGQHDPAGVAVSGSNLYWADNGNGTIWESGLDGSNPVAIVTGQHHPTGVAVGPQ